METATAKIIQADFMKGISTIHSSEEIKVLTEIGYNQVVPQELQDKFIGRKILHHNRIVKLCSKYGLVCGRMQTFTDFIPQRNISEVLNFSKQYNYNNFYSVDRGHLFGKKEVWRKLERTTDYKEVRNIYPSFEYYIAAPSTMIVSDKERSNSPFLPDDPIVFASLNIQSEFGGWNVIVTAWGDEANIEEFQNPLNN
jgi:hypothetical protein